MQRSEGQQDPPASGNAEKKDEWRASYQAPAVNLPKGAGAIKGICEKLAANPVTGNWPVTVPIAVNAANQIWPRAGAFLRLLLWP